MTSVYFQISDTDFLEALRIHNSPKDFALRIVTFKTGTEQYVYLPETTVNELTVLASILRIPIVSGIRNINDLRSYIYRAYRSYYY